MVYYRLIAYQILDSSCWNPDFYYQVSHLSYALISYVLTRVKPNIIRPEIVYIVHGEYSLVL